MKFPFLLIFFVFSTALASDAYIPVLNEDEIVIITNRYISEHTEIELDEFESKNIGFVDSHGKRYSNHWYLIYQKKVEAANAVKSIARSTQWFSVYLTNSKTPEIILKWGY